MSEVYSGYRWKRQTEEHLQDPKFLERYGYKVYSQNDEDGILQEIFDRIELPWWQNNVSGLTRMVRTKRISLCA